MLSSRRCKYKPHDWRKVLPKYVAFRSCLYKILTQNPKQVKLKSVIMSDIIDLKLHEWCREKSTTDARIIIYNKIRDIPYAVIPELDDPEQYVEILNLNKGSCIPKHLLLCDMYQRIGLEVLYAVYPFKWNDLEIDYPSELKKLAEAMPISYHLACKVDIDGMLILVDATLDARLERIGLPVNKEWNGMTDTLLPVNPCGEEELYHPCEASIMQSRVPDEKSLVFYDGLNSWLERSRM